MSRRTICVDFDGVLHSYKSAWESVEVIPDDPNPGAMKFLFDMGGSNGPYEISVFSTRCSSEFGITAMCEWLVKHAAIFLHEKFNYSSEKCDYTAREMVGQIEFASHKVPALVYIDDRAIQFQGTWPTHKELAEFEPWHKKETAKIHIVVPVPYLDSVTRDAANDLITLLNATPKGQFLKTYSELISISVTYLLAVQSPPV